MLTTNNILIGCMPKLSDALAKEVTALGIAVNEQGPSHVKTKGDLQLCMRLNLWLRTASRVLLEISSFEANNANDLYKHVYALPWEELFKRRGGYFSIDSFVRNDTINDNRFANLKVKDAIADRMLKQLGTRPNSGPERNHLVIYLFWVNNQATIYLDTSGQTLAAHGYRVITGPAPMAEPLAAAVMLSTAWQAGMHIVNPMCGSGTLIIEAAQMALKMPVALRRDNFAFMHAKQYRTHLWDDLWADAGKNMLNKVPGRFIASDINTYAIEAARKNAQKAGVAHLVEFNQCHFRDTLIPKGEGIVIMNPEYGQRLGQEEALQPVYKEIGDFFKNKCQGYTGYVFTGNMNLAKNIGLSTKRKIPFLNGKIDCRLLEYELYAGTKKQKASSPQ